MSIEDDIVAFFTQHRCPKGRCYRCWQVGRDTPATLGCIYNSGTGSEWRSASCTSCYERDKREFGSMVTACVKLV